MACVLVDIGSRLFNRPVMSAREGHDRPDSRPVVTFAGD
jgi:hypothetical protein